MSVTIKINGREFTCNAGDNVIKLAIDNGIFIPHYCWHPGLVPEGNCRMCLVKTSTSRKLEVSCMMKAQDKMEVETETDEVKVARKSVLEYLLANHPLDCPVCDKSGECLLQDYTFSWRGGLSRFPGIDEKNLKPTKDLSDKIRIWGNRCIVCTRCTRFYRDVVGDPQLTVVDRGDHSYIDTFPGKPIDNLMSLNVVDICPVGALINKEFLYKARVWFTQQKPTVCNLCSKGCNVDTTVLKNDIKRVLPRHNEKVNGYWMCDVGRTLHYSIDSDRRLRTKIGSVKTMWSAIDNASNKYGINSLGFIISAGNSCKEIDLFKKITDNYKDAHVGFITDTKEEVNYREFKIEAEKTANRNYLEEKFGSSEVSEGLSAISSAINDGKLKVLVVFNSVPFYMFSTEFLLNCSSLEFLSVTSLTETGLEDKANCVIPGRSYLEKEGEFVNSALIRQSFCRVVDPPEFSFDDSEILNELLALTGSAPVFNK